MSSGLFCTRCGHINDAQAAFCSQCGAPQTGGASFTPPPNASAAAAAPAPFVVSPTPAFIGYAGFWIRFLAYIIDALIVGIAFLPFTVLNLGLSTAAEHAADPSAAFAALGVSMMIGFFGFIAGWLYYALMESSSRQATIGKAALGLKVASDAGQRLTFGRATGRYFAKIVSSLTLGIGYLMAGFTTRKQGLHDIIAGTLVLKTR